MNNGFMNGGVGGPPRQHPQPPPHAMQPPMPSSHLSPPPQHMMQAPPEPSYAAAERASKMRDYEVLCQIISQWNANRLDLFALPNEDLEFNGVMRFYYQSQDQDHTGQKVATKC